MTIQSIDLPTEAVSVSLATHFAKFLVAPAVLTFAGDIGVGKTTFIRAMLRALGVNTAIKSPTFSLVESYDCERLAVHHFDLYRIHDEAELDYIGFRDYFSEHSVCCIEWPERAGDSIVSIDLCFSFAIKGSGRLVSIEAFSTTGENMLSCLAGK